MCLRSEENELKGIYIAAIDESKAIEKGVINKIYGQLKAFKKLDIQMDIMHIKDGVTYRNQEFIGGYLSKPTNFNFHKTVREFISKNKKRYDFAYIRFSRGDLEYYKLIKCLNKLDIKIIIEIPTYPYSKQYDYRNIKHLIYGLLDIYIWKALKRYIYRIAVTNDFEYINGIKCINMYNGIDLDMIPIKKSEKSQDSLNLVGIANISKWHGYDRIIKGLSEYYKNNVNEREIRFYLIGEGAEKDNLIKLVNHLNLQKYVIFLGAKSGDELNNSLDIMDIGISSLALFRAGGGHDPIKTKEFIGRGMPVILGYNDKLVDMNLEYILKVSEDESNIDMQEILIKYNSIKKSAVEIRKYAEENLSWESQIYKVINEL